jgi:hypothetical protein
LSRHGGPPWAGGRPSVEILFIAEHAAVCWRRSMRVFERRRSQSATSDDAPFSAIIGALVGILISVPLWALIVLLIRRLLGA